MSERRYSEDEIRELLASLAQPMIAVRGGIIVAVNESYLEHSGYRRDQIEGQPFTNLMPPEERRRMAELSARKRAGQGVTGGLHNVVLGLTPEGKLEHLDVHTQHLPAQEGEPYTVATVFRLRARQSEVDLAELLVAASAQVVPERTPLAVRDAARACFEKAGFHAAFYEDRARAWTVRDGGLPIAGFDPAYASEAIDEGRAVFAGSQDNLSPTHAYLPVRDGEAQEVLVLSGPFDSSRHASALLLFARVLSSALESARLHEASGRRLEDTRLQLELARITSGTLDLQTILDVACDGLVKLLDVTDCFVGLYDPRAKVFRGAGASARYREPFRSLVFPISQRSMSSAIYQARATVTMESREELLQYARLDVVERFGIQALAGIPLIARDELIGQLVLSDSRAPRKFSQEWRQRAEASASQLALSIANAQLFASLRTSYAELESARAENVRRERFAALGELSALVAHEVRNPLGVIFNAVSSLRRQVPPLPETQLLLDILSEESERLNRMVAELLDFASPRELALEPEDLGRVIHESLDAARLHPGREKGGEVVFREEIDPDLPRVPIDRWLIRQALVNVAVNAIQAMPKGGTVRVRAGRETVAGEERLRIDLSDDGPGIPPEISARIFEPFFTTKAKGTGLGLAVVKRIVEQHRGEVEVRSASGQGTTFTFHLPLTAQGARTQP